MAARAENERIPCDYCGHVTLVSRMVRFGPEGAYRYACPSCAIKVDPHAFKVRSRPPEPPAPGASRQ